MLRPYENNGIRNDGSQLSIDRLYGEKDTREERPGCPTAMLPPGSEATED